MNQEKQHFPNPKISSLKLNQKKVEVLQKSINKNPKDKQKVLEEETLRETIQRGNKFYVIEQTSDESREVYLDRVHYIINKLEAMNIDTDINDQMIQNTILSSLIWRNIHFYKMTYPSTVMKSFRDI